MDKNPPGIDIDVEDAVFANFIRRPREDEVEKPKQYCIPLLLRDVKNISRAECSSYSNPFHIFNRQLTFRTILVWARIVSIVQERNFNHIFLVDDNTSVMWVRVAKKEEDKLKSQALINQIDRKRAEADMQTWRDVRNVMFGLNALLDYSRLRQYQSVLIYGVPADIQGKIGVRAFAIVPDNKLGCDSGDFEVSYKEMLIDWYIKNKPQEDEDEDDYWR